MPSKQRKDLFWFRMRENNNENKENERQLLGFNDVCVFWELKDG